jgi:copper chaperone CopZ
MALSTAVLSVQGITCTSTIVSRIGQLEGVMDVGISIEKGEVCVAFSPQSALSPQILAEKISEMGFEASVKESSGTQEVVFCSKGMYWQHKNPCVL